MNSKDRMRQDEPMNLEVRFARMSETNRSAIKILHMQLREIKENPEDFDYPVQLIEDIEYTLQGIWGFTRNKDYHSHWMEIKGCTCPKMDNRDPFYFGRRIVFEDCPWHAKGDES